jgi:hypothetical protein
MKQYNIWPFPIHRSRGATFSEVIVAIMISMLVIAILVPAIAMKPESDKPEMIEFNDSLYKRFTHHGDLQLYRLKDTLTNKEFMIISVLGKEGVTAIEVTPQAEKEK